VNRHDRRKWAAARRTAKIIKSAGLAPTHWFWVGAGDPPAFDKDRVADYVLNQRLRGQEGTCRFHIVNSTTGQAIYFAAAHADGELLITVCETEEQAVAVYARIKPPDAEPLS
jgi:hypothetical protein